MQEFARRFRQRIEIGRLVNSELELIRSKLQLRPADRFSLIERVLIVHLKTRLLRCFHGVIAAGGGYGQQNGEYRDVNGDEFVALSLGCLVEGIGRGSADDPDFSFFGVFRVCCLDLCGRESRLGTARNTVRGLPLHRLRLRSPIIMFFHASEHLCFKDPLCGHLAVCIEVIDISLARGEVKLKNLFGGELVEMHDQSPQ